MNEIFRSNSDRNIVSCLLVYPKKGMVSEGWPQSYRALGWQWLCVTIHKFCNSLGFAGSVFYRRPTQHQKESAFFPEEDKTQVRWLRTIQVRLILSFHFHCQLKPEPMQKSHLSLLRVRPLKRFKFIICTQTYRDANNLQENKYLFVFFPEICSCHPNCISNSGSAVINTVTHPEIHLQSTGLSMYVNVCRTARYAPLPAVCAFFANPLYKIQDHHSARQNKARRVSAGGNP